MSQELTPASNSPSRFLAKAFEVAFGEPAGISGKRRAEQ